MKRLFAVIAIALMASGCVTNGGSNYGNKAIFGTLLGAAGGGFAGSKIGSGRGQLAATAAGALLGALVGNGIGQSMDNVDRMAANRATQTAIYRAPVGQQVQWSNPNTGNYGRTMTTREGYQPSTNRYCREYRQEITVGGRTQQAYGTACRQPDGSWQISNSGTTSRTYAQSSYAPQQTYYHADNPPRYRYPSPQPTYNY